MRKFIQFKTKSHHFAQSEMIRLPCFHSKALKTSAFKAFCGFILRGVWFLFRGSGDPNDERLQLRNRSHRCRFLFLVCAVFHAFFSFFFFFCQHPTVLFCRNPVFFFLSKSNSIFTPQYFWLYWTFRWAYKGLKTYPH